MINLRRIGYLILTAIAAMVVFNYRPQLSEVVVPGDVKGMESSSKLIYGTGTDRTPTALGQVFKVPSNHPVLANASFLVTFPTYDRMPASGPGVTRSMRVRLRINEWNGQKMVGDSLFESKVLELAKVDGKPRYDWIEFPVDKLRLIPGRMYLAWITGVDLLNTPYDSFGIVRMGARTWSGSAKKIEIYPDGYMVTWDKDTTDRSLKRMFQEAWRPEEMRASLHFKMTFRSR